VTTKIAGAAASGLVALFIYFAGAYTLLVDGESAWQWVRQNSPLRPAQLDRFGAAFHETGRGLLIGVGLTSATQALAATVAYLALGVPRALVLGPITGLASVIPFLGTALVWGPIAVSLFIAGHTIKGIILVIIGVTVIGTIDNVLRPVYARLGTLQMPMFLLFVSVFGGLGAFGTWGAILGPLIVRLAMEALSLRKEAEATEPGPV
jgi:predicted PurR-regulated permease PerM